MQFNTHVQIREEKFGTVIFETLREKIFVTNPTGAEIVKLLQEKKSPEQIITDLAAKYDAAPSAVADDVKGFVDRLVQNQILV